MASRYVLVDLKHPSGFTERRHQVEIGEFVRNVDAAVEEHLRVKSLPKAHGSYRIAGGWTWEYSKDVEKKSADPKPKA